MLEGKYMKEKTLKVRLLFEIVFCFALMQINVNLFTWIANKWLTDGLWIGVASYLTTIVVIFLYVTKIEKHKIKNIGLKPLSLSDIPKGIFIGICMFIVQQLPMIFIGFNYASYAKAPNWIYIIVMSLYCIFCVGFAEELIFRGFILHKSYKLFNSKIIAILINCLLFYIFHWPPVRFVFGEFFNTTINTIILCILFYKSKNKSIVPLIIAHSVYDILTVYLLPVVVFYFK